MNSAPDNPVPEEGSKVCRLAMGRRRGLFRAGRLMLFGMVAVVGGLAFWLMRDNGSVVRGRSAQDWFRRYQEFGETDPRGIEAAEAIQALGDDSLPFLYQRLTEPESSALAAFWKGVGARLPRSMQGWVEPKRLRHPWECAGELLEQIRPSAEALMEILAEPLADPQHERYILALHLLRTAGDGAPRVVPYLVSALLHTNYNQSTLAASSLTHLGESAREAVPALMRITRQALIPQSLTVHALGAIGPSAEAAVPLLEELVENATSEGLRRQARVALCQIQPGHPGLQTLIREAAGDDPDRRHLALLDLWSIGPPARAAVPVLQATIGEQDEKLEVAALWALQRIDPGNHAAAGLFLDRLAGSDDSPRTEVPRLNWALSLARMEPPEPAGIEALAHIVRSGRNTSCRLFAMSDLYRLGARAASANPSLEAALKDPDPDVREAAACTLRRIEGADGEIRIK